IGETDLTGSAVLKNSIRVREPGAERDRTCTCLKFASHRFHTSVIGILCSVGEHQCNKIVTPARFFDAGFNVVKVLAFRYIEVHKYFTDVGDRSEKRTVVDETSYLKGNTVNDSVERCA